MSPYTHGVLVSKEWVDELADQIRELRLWLLNPAHVDDLLEDIADTLVEKHHDYGEENLAAFGELGVLVRASDQVARLKNLLDKEGTGKNESREDTWRDLAGYAVQALIMMKKSQAKPVSTVDLFEIRRNRLVRGFCPDCGEGVLLRRQLWHHLTVHLFCSERCGFETEVDVFEMEGGDTGEMIHRLARLEAVEEQR